MSLRAVRLLRSMSDLSSRTDETLSLTGFESDVPPLSKSAPPTPTGKRSRRVQLDLQPQIVVPSYELGLSDYNEPGMFDSCEEMLEWGQPMPVKFTDLDYGVVDLPSAEPLEPSLDDFPFEVSHIHVVRPKRPPGLPTGRPTRKP